jgi:hypothetical protein
MGISPLLTGSVRTAALGLIWETGEPIDVDGHDLDDLEFVCETLPRGTFPDYAVSDMGCPIVSARFRTVLEENGVDNVEYFPASVIERPGEDPLEGYFAANVVGLEECIDREQTRGDLDTDGPVPVYWGIEHLVLKDDDPGTDPVYRASSFLRLVLIEERLAAAFRDDGIVGVRCIEPERWDGFSGEK